MPKVEDVVRLRIFLSESDEYKGHPRYQEIIAKAQEARIAGATVFRGFLGYGQESGLHLSKILKRSKDVPVVIEILETEAKVQKFLDVYEKILTGCIVTVEKIQMYRFAKQPTMVVAED